MATIKGLQKLNNAIFNELKQFDIDSTFLNDSYEYRFDENSVGWTVIETDVDDIFNEFVLDRFDYVVEDTFFISLMHEIGHRMTEDDISGFAYDVCLEEKEKIMDALCDAEDEDEIKKLHYRYFNLPDELSATLWAITFIREHPKKSKKIQENIQKALFEFYDKNID